MPDFFDRHPVFFKSSNVGSHPQRLKNRYRAIIEKHLDAITGRRILDLGSHDGRWCFAAHDAGAKYVLGIEGRREATKSALAIRSSLDIPENRIAFRTRNAIEWLSKNMEPFDTIFCLGFFYHVPFHYAVFDGINRTDAKHVIIDTKIADYDEAVVQFKLEDAQRPGRSIALRDDNPSSVIGIPSDQFIRFLAEYFGFKVAEVDWRSLNIDDWSGCEDYHLGTRKTYLCRRDK